MKKKIREIAALAKNNREWFLFDEDTSYPYPEIEDNETNFITDYNDLASTYNRYFVKEYGERTVEYDALTDTEFLQIWQEDIFATTCVYLSAWARLYYALDISYNPVYNVEEHTTTKYGQHETDFLNAARQHTTGQQQNTNGQQIDTIGSHIDTSTMKNVAIDSALEKESSKQEDNYAQRQDTKGQRIDTLGQRVDSDLSFTDTTTSKQHTDQTDRVGNIGVKSATELVNEEIRQKKRLSFFKNVFLVFVEEMGAYYEPDFLQ